MRNEMISVIVPVYQVAAFLPKCLDSILDQTYRNLEIILVDDGSTDKSGKICDDYAQKDSRITVIHKKNGGLVSARKAAMKIAKGELIAYVDSDDWIDADMYEAMYQKMDAVESDIVIVGHTEEFADKTTIWTNDIPTGDYFGNELLSVYEKMLYNEKTYYWSLSPACWDKLFRRKIVEQYQMRVDDRIWDGEDHAFTYTAILNADRISIMDISPYHHRVRTDSVSQVFDIRAFERLGILYEGLRSDYHKSGYWEVLKKPFAYQMRWFLLKHMKTELGVDVYEKGEAVRPYIFPFSDVLAGSKIILYGAGNVGSTFYRQIKKTGYCEIVAWVSKDFRGRQSKHILPPDVLSELDFDVVVIAVESEKNVEEIRTELGSMNIGMDKVIWVRPQIDEVEAK